MPIREIPLKRDELEQVLRGGIVRVIARNRIALLHGKLHGGVALDARTPGHLIIGSSRKKVLGEMASRHGSHVRSSLGVAVALTGSFHESALEQTRHALTYVNPAVRWQMYKKDVGSHVLGDIRSLDNGYAVVFAGRTAVTGRVAGGLKMTALGDYQVPMARAAALLR